MRRGVTLTMTILLLVAVGALAAGTASATQWLKGGKSLSSAESAEIVANIRLSKNGGALGAGEVECNFYLEGTVGPGMADKITLLVNLSATELDLVSCTRLNGFCFSPVVHPEKLPWNTELVLIFGVTWDYVESGGLELVCTFGKVLCSGRVQVKFTKNGANGAESEYVGAESGEQTCSDGGKGTYTGRATALGFTVS